MYEREHSFVKNVIVAHRPVKHIIVMKMPFIFHIVWRRYLHSLIVKSLKQGLSIRIFQMWFEPQVNLYVLWLAIVISTLIVGLSVMDHCGGWQLKYYG